MASRDILVVFDIDETLIQFINTQAYHHWLKFRSEASEEDISRFDRMIEFNDYPEQNQVVLFRPGLREFLEMAKENGRIKLAIWTYSEQTYANRIAREICDKFGIEKEADPFIFKYSSDQIDDDIPKSLKQIWNDPNFGSKFNKFNTFLVDDRYENLSHKTNNRNSILIQAFAPFGEIKKTRQAMTPGLLTKAVNDNIFSVLTEISNKILEDIDGCSADEVAEALKSESVFAPKCMKRRGLSEYDKEYEKDVKLVTIGEVENARDPNKGGRRTKKRINYNKTRRSKGGKKGKKSMQRFIKNVKSKRYHRR
jgi:hypothetical protein